MPVLVKPLYYRRRSRQLWYKDQYPYTFFYDPRSAIKWQRTGFFKFIFPPSASFHQCSILIFHSSTTDVNIILKADSALKQSTSLSLSMLTFFVKPFQCRIFHVTNCHKAWSSHFAPNVPIRVRHRIRSRAESAQFTTGLSIFLRSNNFWSDNNFFQGTFSTKFCTNLLTR